MKVVLKYKAVSNYQQSAVSFETFNFLIFCLKDPFGELFLKIKLESSADIYFSRNREKLSLAIGTLQPPSKMEIIWAYS